MDIFIPETIVENTEELLVANEGLAAQLELEAEVVGLLPELHESPVAGLGVAQCMRDMIYKGGFVVALHPWVYGLGEVNKGNYSEPNNAFLTPNNAIAHLRKKLTDVNDSDKDVTQEMVYILVSADELQEYAQQLEILEVIFPIGEMIFCKRRAVQLMEINEKKYIRKTAFVNPHWKGFAVTASQRNLLSKIEAIAAFNDACAQDLSPNQELIEEINAKIAEMAAFAEQWEALVKEIELSEKCAAGYLTGSPSSIAEQLRLLNFRDRKYCCLVSVVAAEVGDLIFFREALGI